jgi:hypothetical protein
VAPASQQLIGFHSTARREEEVKGEKPAAAGDDGFMGTGLSHLYAIPIGVAFAVPAIEFEWFVFNEETLVRQQTFFPRLKPVGETLVRLILIRCVALSLQLASTFLAFCVVAYNQGGDLLSNAMKDEAKAMLKQQNDAEDKVIAKLEETVEYMKLTENIVEDYQNVLDLTTESYAKLNAAGKIKPQHELKGQVEKILTLIAAEEHNAYDKAKNSLMSEATASVTAEFATSKDLQKAGLDAALAKLTGKASGIDPVQAAYLSFFKKKSAAAQTGDDAAEAKAARKAMIAKLNATCDNESMFFRLDAETGKPKMVV